MLHFLLPISINREVKVSLKDIIKKTAYISTFANRELYPSPVPTPPRPPECLKEKINTLPKKALLFFNVPN